MKKLAAVIFAMFLTANANSQTVLAGGFGTDGLGVINGNTYSKTGTLGSGGFPFVSASKDGSTFYASSPSTSKLYFINVATMTFTDSMSIYVRNLASSNEPNILFALTTKALCRINTATKSVVDSIVLGAPWQVEERPNSKEVWVSDSGKMHVVDYTTSLSATTINFTSSPYDYGGAKFSTGGSMAFKGASVAKKIYKINALTHAIVDSVTTSPSGYSNMVVSHDSSKLFVCDPNTLKVRVFNTSDLSVADSIDCGVLTPINIYRHPDRNEIWVVHHFSDSISVYNENTGALIAAFDAAGSPWYIAFADGGPTSIDHNGSAQALRIYPNPVNDWLSIEGMRNGSTVSAFGLNGSKMASWISTGQVFDVHSFKPGIYFLTINDKEGKLIAETQFVKL